MKICEYCGSQQNDDRLTNCTNCGAVLPAPLPVASSSLAGGGSATSTTPPVNIKPSQEKPLGPLNLAWLILCAVFAIGLFSSNLYASLMFISLAGLGLLLAVSQKMLMDGRTNILARLKRWQFYTLGILLCLMWLRICAGYSGVTFLVLAILVLAATLLQKAPPQ